MKNVSTQQLNQTELPTAEGTIQCFLEPNSVFAELYMVVFMYFWKLIASQREQEKEIGVYLCGTCVMDVACVCNSSGRKVVPGFPSSHLLRGALHPKTRNTLCTTKAT